MFRKKFSLLVKELVYTYIYLNHEAEKWSPGATGKSLLKLQPGVVEVGIFDTFKQVVETGIPNRSERHYVHEQFNGWFYQSAVKLGDGVATTTTDISERKKAEQQLRRNEGLLQSVLSNTSSSIMLLMPVRDTDNKVIDFEYAYTNDQLLKSVKRSSLIGKRLIQEFPNVKSNELFQHFTRVADTGQDWGGDIRVNYDGFDVWAQVFVTRIDGNILVTYFDITGKKKSEREILALKDEIAQNATDKYYSLFNSIDEGFCIQKMVCDKNGKLIDLEFVEANPAYEKQTGLKRADIIGKRLSEVSIIDDFEHLLLLHSEVAETAKPLTAETYSKYLDRWFEFNIYKSAADELSIFIRDTSKRKRAEQALRGSKKCFESIANLVPDLLWDSEPDGSTDWYNQRWLEYTGQRFEEAVGWGWVDAIHPNDVQGSARRYAEAVEAGNPLRQEHRIRRYDGEYRWFVVNASPFKDENGRVLKMYGAATDIHDSKQAEKALRKSEEKYRTLFNSIDEGFLIHEMVRNDNGQAVDFRLLEVNPAFTRQTGLEKDAVGKLASEFLPNLEQFWIDTYDRVARTGVPERVENYNQATHRWYSVHISPVGRQGRRVAAVFEDVTERKRREANLAFLAEISQDLVKMDKPEKTLEILGAKICAHFGTIRSLFVEITENERTAIVRDWHMPGLKSTAGEVILSQFVTEKFHQQCRNGKTVIIENVHQSDLVDGKQIEEVFGVNAFVLVPLLRNRQWIYTIGIHSGQPRKWRDDEINLLHELASRIWARLEKARAEEALQQREQELARVQEIGKVGGVDVDVENDLKARRSPEYLRLHGLPPDTETETHEDWLRRLHPDDRETAEKTLFTALNGNHPSYESEYRIIRPDNGEIRWVYAKLDIERDSRGKPIRMIGVHIDITRRKVVEEALRESEERLRIVLEGIGEPFYVLDSDWRFLFISRSALKIWKKTQQDVLGKRFLEAFPNAAGSDAYAAHLRVMETGVREHMETVSPVLKRWVEIDLSVTRTGLLSVAFRDISERKQAEEELKLSEERFRTALNSADMAAWDWNVADDTIVWNEQHYYILGLQPDGKLQKAENFLRYLHPEDVGMVTDELTKAINETDIYRAEFRIIREDGKVCWMSGYGRSVRFDNKGKATRMVGVMYDISEAKQKEKLKDEFISIASHELKTPVASIKAYAELVEERLGEIGNTDDSELLSKLNRQIDRLTALIDNLLDSTKLSAGLLKLDLEPVDLNELLSDKVHEIERMSHHKFLLFLSDIPIVMLDRGRIGQVLANLFSNAIKYSPDKSTVTVSGTCDEEWIFISVKDDGFGIPQADIDHVFDKFFRVASNNMNTFPGMGLGLYITQQIVRAHGGWITVKSVEGNGSVFTFQLSLIYPTAAKNSKV